MTDRPELLAWLAWNAESAYVQWPSGYAPLARHRREWSDASSAEVARQRGTPTRLLGLARHLRDLQHERRERVGQL